MVKLTEIILRNKYLCEYKGYGSFDDFKNRYCKLQNEWRTLTFETLSEISLLENDTTQQIERDKVIKLIQNNQFEVNNPQAFYAAAQKSKRGEMLTNYTPQEYKEMKTFLLKGYDIGYAVKNDGDIVSVFNNSRVPNIGSELVKSAIRNGGNKLDHYDGYLSKFYEPLGFKEYDRAKWDDSYHQNDNWDYEKNGRPDIIWRKLN